jgi:G3E family GTPase
MVTIIDAHNFFNEFKSKDYLHDRNLAVSEADERTLVDLLIDQIEFANVIIINKSDLVTKKELNAIQDVIGKLNAEAEILVTSHGSVPLNKIVNTKIFNMDYAEQNPMWLKEARIGEHVAETEEYGISSFVFRADKPFHPARLMQFVMKEMKGIIRSKGYCWIATRRDRKGVWAQAGTMFYMLPGEKWHFKKDKPRQQIVIIGVALNKPWLVTKLNECLLTDSELTQFNLEAVPDFADPFPKWLQESI